MNHEEYTSRLLDALGHALGPIITDYLQAETTTEIMANPDGSVWIEDLQKGMFSSGLILSENERYRVINAVATACDTECTWDKPELAANLPGSGYRFQAVIPPIAAAPSFTVRKSAVMQFSLEDYVAGGQLTQAQAALIRQAAQEKKNFLVVGGTSSGKTTFANSILAEICQPGEQGIFPRVLLLEDARELRSPSPNTVSLTTNHKAGIAMVHLLRICMRYNPTRIILGEVRDGRAALELLKALNSGHPGGCTTIHADSAQKGLRKLLQYLGEEIKNPQPELVADAIDIIVYLEKTPAGRKVKEILQLNGLDEFGRFELSPLDLAPGLGGKKHGS